MGKPVGIQRFTHTHTCDPTSIPLETSSQVGESLPIPIPVPMTHMGFGNPCHSLLTASLLRRLNSEISKIHAFH